MFWKLVNLIEISINRFYNNWMAKLWNFKGLTFEIAEGGFLDIDVKIIGPDNKVVHQAEQETSGKYTFAAHAAGDYTYCFSNQKSTMTPKVVMFDMHVGDPPKAPGFDAHAAGTDTNSGKLDEMIQHLSKSLWGVRDEQEYMQVILTSKNIFKKSLILLWSIHYISPKAVAVYFLKILKMVM